MHTGLRVIQTRLNYRMWRVSGLMGKLSSAATPTRFLDIFNLFLCMLLIAYLPMGLLWFACIAFSFWCAWRCGNDIREVWRELRR